jgi:hypothetical protein
MIHQFTRDAWANRTSLTTLRFMEVSVPSHDIEQCFICVQWKLNTKLKVLIFSYRIQEELRIKEQTIEK